MTNKILNSIRLIFLSFGLAISAWAPMIPFIKSRFELDDIELGIILFIFGMGALTIMPITGFFVNKFGSRKIILISGISVVLLLPLISLAPTISTLSCLLFFFGISTGAMNVSMNAQAVDIEKVIDRSIMSGVHSWFSIGGLLGASIVTILLEMAIDLSLSITSISLIVLYTLIKNQKNLLEKQSVETIIKTCSFTIPNKKVILLGGICFIAFMAEGSILDWGAVFLRSSLNYDPSFSGIGYAIFSISMALGRLMGDSIIKKIGSLLTFQIGCLLAAFGFLSIVNFLSYGALLGFCLVGMGASNIVPILFSSSGKIENTSSNNSLTFITTCGYMGLLFGPAMIGVIAEMTSLSLSFYLIAFFLFSILTLGKIALPRREVLMVKV